jgi:superkiller protein 3
MARGYVHEFSKRWDEAREDFDKAVALLEPDDPHHIEAAEESAWCQVQNGELEAGIRALNDVIRVLDTLTDHETAQARAWWRLGKATWNDNDEETFPQAYRLWITSLKRSTSFAPAYTSLGIYYTDYAKPPDVTRASKCFQKAFELDSREAEAARRLAEGFVDEREWDLADIVARRTIEGEGGTGGESRNDIDSRHKPTNVWAWKVVGLVALVCTTPIH